MTGSVAIAVTAAAGGGGGGGGEKVVPLHVVTGENNLGIEASGESRSKLKSPGDCLSAPAWRITVSV